MIIIIWKKLKKQQIQQILKKEYKALNAKLKELTSEELKQVVGGQDIFVPEIEAPLPPVNDPIIK